jgi:hypothetical protein
MSKGVHYLNVVMIKMQTIASKCKATEKNKWEGDRVINRLLIDLRKL